MSPSDLLAIITIILWPAIPLFWIPVHCVPDFFRRLGLFTYILPLVTWLPVAYIFYHNRFFLLQFSTELPDAVNILGIFLLSAGTLLQIWTGLLLKFRGLIGLPEVSEKTEGRLVTEGPFSVVRHPTYLAHTLMFSGVFLMTEVTAVGIVTLIDLVVMNTVVIPLEEKELLRRFGEEYKQYRKKTARFIPFIACALAALFIFPGCSRPVADRLQGYVEGEFVYVASPLSGALAALYVQRGAQVKAGDPLFTLENVSEKAARDEAERRLAQARAGLEDAKKGKRPSEIESLSAQLRQAQAALDLSEKELSRQERLLRSGATASQDVDRIRSTHEQNRQRAAQIEADLKTAQLGSRSDQLAAAAANVRALEAALVRQEWDFSQKRQTAPQAGLVFDTLYREGEWIAAGRPVVALLPPQNVKVRAFVPEARISAIRRGDSVRVFVDGVRGPFIGKVSFISPRAEYTPPVIYSREGRSRLVFMVEAVFDPKTAADLHPGQPVDVQFGS